MAKRDYYDILGISKGAGKDEIKKAYRRLAMKNHPDRNPDDAEAEARFKEASEAYEVLSDDRKRQAYDQFGHAGLGGAAATAGRYLWHLPRCRTGSYPAGLSLDPADLPGLPWLGQEGAQSVQEVPR